MKWRRKKSPGLPPPPLPQIFSISWLSKLKQMRTTNKTKSKSAKPKQKCKPEPPQSSSVPVCFSPSRPSNVGSRSSLNVGSASNRCSLSKAKERAEKNVAKFMVPDDDYWRFSFAKQSSEGSESGGCSEDETEVRFLSCKSCRSNGKYAGKDICKYPEAGKFNDMLSDARNTKLEMIMKKGRSKSVDYSSGPRFQTPQWIAMKDQEVTAHELKTADETILEGDMVFCRGPFHEDRIGMKQEQKILEPLSRKSDRNTAKTQPKFMPLDSRKMDQSNMKDSTRILNSEQKLVEDDQKIANVPSKNNKQGNGASNSPFRDRDSHRRKIRHRPRIGVYSPRTSLRMEVCKIRAVEDLKKAKKKREKQKGRAFESFAVVKCSFNPHQDFRESMMEMIFEHGIRHPEELESLLACYLSLNSDEYHDVIVKVFRQVWFDLNHHCSISKHEGIEERH